MFPQKIAALTIAVLLVSCGATAGEDSGPDVELRDGERVVLLGGSLIEREQKFGYWEMLLTAASAGKKVTFRNLGWSGDTVWGESRGMFEPQFGCERLVEQVQAAQPTLVIIAYGNNEAFAGPSRLADFNAQYQQLLRDLEASDRRFVLLSPLLMEADQLPPDPDAPSDYANVYNESVNQYAEAIRSLAQRGGHELIDLRPFQKEHVTATHGPLTSNGLHLTDAGYRQTARWLARWVSPSAGVVALDFDAPRAAELREAIITKNRYVFHRWRPQNFTYLFGFRTYEQGQNAAEVPRFDPLINEAEQRIAALAETVRISGQED